jgi:hypothetical protein
MSSEAIKPIIYSSIEEKNILERGMFKPMSPKESLIHTLAMMDFFAALRKKRVPHPDDEKYPWIILKVKE